MIEISKYKGYIKCPFCGDKAMVMNDAHGRASHRCKCGKFLLFDYDKMVAEPGGVLRGAAKYFMDRTNIADHRLSR